jgi:hypothetical protein
MINIPPLRTKRLTVQMKEISMKDAIALATIPERLQQASASFFLNAVIEQSDGVESPDDWTVQERTMAVCHYMSATFDDGPDFALAGGDARYSDYLIGGEDYPGDHVDLGEVEGDKWSIRPLTGRMANAIERLEGEVEGIAGYAHWQVGLMAAQLVPNGRMELPEQDGELDTLLLERMRVFAQYPESVFIQLLERFHAGTQQLQHLLTISFDRSGIVVLPADREGNAAKPPARFPVGTCITAFARRMGREHGDDRA